MHSICVYNINIMKQLRFSFIALIFFVGIVLNLERFDIGQQIDIINIHSFFYVLFGIAVLSTLAFTALRRVPMPIQLVSWIGIYLICKLFIFTDRPFIGGVYTYLSITEVTLLALGVLLSHRTTEDLFAFETVIANINLSGVSSRVMEFDQAGDEIAKEFIRSRRYKIPLSVLVLKLDPEIIKANRDNSMEEVILSLMTRYTANSLVRVLDKELRRTDLIIEQTRRNRLILLFPETDAAGSKVMTSRIEQLTEKHLGISISCGSATFPDEAITFEELVQRAEEHYSYQLVHLADIVADHVEDLWKQRDRRG